jgi:NAD(P)-dependent dehydrogenase (short-subunit alcohol dehydrogenase family)
MAAAGNSGTSIDGKVALITGAGPGLGRVEALALAAAGAQVVVNDLGAGADRVCAEIRDAGGEATAAPGDVGDWDFAAGLVGQAISRYGRLDILVNNAGMIRDKMIFSMTADDWDPVVRVHLRGHAATTSAAAAYWRNSSKSAGGPIYARLINTTSESALFGNPGQPNYAAAKYGITALTLAVAGSCAKYGVRANAIAPRARTPMTEAMMPPKPESGVDLFGTEHIPPVVLWLASPAGDVVNGQVFVTYGGRLAVLAAPTVEHVYRTSGEIWTPEELAATVGPAMAEGKHGGFAVSTALRID